MILAFLMATVAFAALLPVVLPLVRGVRTAPGRAAFDQAVYRDQLRELDRDIARGLITEAEAQGARLEIQRRLLGAAGPEEPSPATDAPAQAARNCCAGPATRDATQAPRDLATQSPAVEPPQGGVRGGVRGSFGGGSLDGPQGGSHGGPRGGFGGGSGDGPHDGPQVGLQGDPGGGSRGGPRGGMATALAVLVLVGGGSVALYTVLGQPGLPDMPFAARPGDAGAGGDQIRQAVAQLEARLRAEPGNADGWLLYARANTLLGRWDAVADAYRRAISLGRAGPDVLASYGEALVLGAQGTVSPAAREAFAGALRGDPANAMARFYTALATGQGGEPRRAIEQLQALAADMPADSPVRGEIGRQVENFARIAGITPPPLAAGRAGGAVTAPGPDADAVAAAAQMSPADRKSMIEGMVGRLAARLEADPNDADGWLRLGRAYLVLEQRDKAADAYERASALRPGDIAIRVQAVDALLAGLPPTAQVPPRALAMLRQIEAANPNEPTALWYLGLVAAQERQIDAARQYWTRLLVLLPAGGDEARLVSTALEALKGRRD